MEALLIGKHKLSIWLKSTVKRVIKRAKKQVRKLKGQPPTLTSWTIIKLIA